MAAQIDQNLGEVGLCQSLVVMLFEGTLMRLHVRYCLFCAFVVSLTLLSFLTVCNSAPQLKPDPILKLSYPDTLGAKWVYTDGKVEVVDSVIKVESGEDGKYVSIARIHDGRALLTDVLLVTNNAILLVESAGAKLDTQRPLIKFPFKHQRWVVDGYSISNSGPDEIVVPAGKYLALSVTKEFNFNKTAITVVEWYAPNIGLVKRVTKIGTKRETLELKSFSEKP